ncbi:MAG: asparagine synthase (glutamine-hydrolyzing) [Steroidobacteraceae bacterium]
MCGFAGFIHANAETPLSETEAVLQNMGRQIQHRGPDDSGVWADIDAGIGLAHRRLSILDLTSAGHQPMVSRSGRYVIAFNGEIYNHLDLRKILESKISSDSTPSNHYHETNIWRGSSDTETLLAGFDVWGISETIDRSVGMFALAIWDRNARTLSLARDRLGEKPLYYGWQRNAFLFGSELKALKVHPEFCADVDRSALTLLLRHNCIPAPYSIYNGIKKLPPGTVLTVSLRQRNNQPIRYWDVRKIAARGYLDPFTGSPSEAIDTLDVTLREAISQQMLSDVALGAFLSGGVDSSTVVALMQAQSSRPVRTFTIGFHESGYNEAEHAKAVSRYLGTEHTELYVSPQQALDIIPRLPLLYDEPFSDSSQIPTFLLSEMTRQTVTVCLSGDAGDELFGGYGRYTKALQLRKRIPQALKPVRSLLSKLASIMAGMDAVRDDNWWQLSDLLASRNMTEFYRPRVSHWKRPERVVINGIIPPTVFDEMSTEVESYNDFVAVMMVLDTMTYLPDDILVKLDRAAMGVSLETRIPYLDHRVVEFAWTLPMSMKIRGDQTKWILRQLLYRYVPKELVERPKKGFSIPIDVWLRGPLREWAESLLSEPRLRNEGYFDPKPIRRKWAEHLSGQHNWQYHLWDILMFQSWLEHVR